MTMAPIFDRKQMADLYASGFDDGEIADKMGCSREVVKKWRRQTGRSSWSPCNRTERYMADYEAGYSDHEISKRHGRSKCTVWAWRKNRGLPPNIEPNPKQRPPGTLTEKLREAWQKKPSATSIEIGNIVGCNPAYARTFRLRGRHIAP